MRASAPLGISRIVATVAIVALALACATWTLWDDLFTRRSVAGSRGWTGGDAALSVPLPHSDDTLWVFGDSLVTDWDLELDQRIFGRYPLAEIVFGSVVAIQRDSTWPDPSKIEFYARSNGKGPVDPVTRDVVGRRDAFFDHATLGRNAPQTLTTIWPQGAECLGCDGDDPALALSFKEVEKCDPSTGPEDCIALCEISRGEPVPREECQSGVRVVNQLLSLIENPEEPMEAWQASSIATAPPDVSWGTALLETKNLVLIYGALERHGTTDAVLAVSLPENLLEMDRWWVYTNRGFRSGAQLGQVEGGEEIVPAVIARDVGALFSVDAIRRAGKTRYLLSHAHPTGDNLMFMRLSHSPFGWPDLDRKSVRIDLQSHDPTLARVARDWSDRGICEPQLGNGVADESRCGITYHGMTHAHLSTLDRQGPSELLYSYIVPMGPADGSRSADYFRPRFGNVSLELLPPWCKRSKRPCMQGLNHFFADQRVESGQRTEYRFDVSAARRLILDFDRGSVGIEVAVRFEVEDEQIVRACRPRRGTRPTSQLECTVRIPRGAEVAQVEVETQTSTHYDLRVSYDSWLGVEEVSQARSTAGKLVQRRRPKLRRGIHALGLKRAGMHERDDSAAKRSDEDW